MALFSNTKKLELLIDYFYVTNVNGSRIKHNLIAKKYLTISRRKMKCSVLNFNYKDILFQDGRLVILACKYLQHILYLSNCT